MSIKLNNGLKGTVSAHLFKQPLEEFLAILFTSEALINGVEPKKAEKVLTDLYNTTNGVSRTAKKAKESESESRGTAE